MFCPACGKEAVEDKKFCAGCGAPLVNTKTEQPRHKCEETEIALRKMVPAKWFRAIPAKQTGNQSGVRNLPQRIKNVKKQIARGRHPQISRQAYLQ